MENQRISLVTGGSSGIGQAVTVALARRGDFVVFTYRNASRAAETAELVQAAGGMCQAEPCSIESLSDTAGLVRRIVREHGRIDCFAHCAAISNVKTIDEIDEAEWDTMLDANLKGPFFLTRVVCNTLKARTSGQIVMITSIAGQRGGKFSGVHYSASKGGLETMMKCFALLGAEYQVTCNAVSPGVADTPMSREEGIATDDIPLGRAAVPEEVADAVVFLLSEQARYITGTTLDVNGGQMMR